jgi:hypothetical protein
MGMSGSPARASSSCYLTSSGWARTDDQKPNVEPAKAAELETEGVISEMAVADISAVTRTRNGYGFTVWNVHRAPILELDYRTAQEAEVAADLLKAALESAIEITDARGMTWKEHG